ncbi:MAG: hypothetical protein HOA17_01145 [Candidatus Melainabacteria bacterium]|jgi:hypothetical protein|nr:hypothetical protein [Candidatus Melainabacteria bacterium]
MEVSKAVQIDSAKAVHGEIVVSNTKTKAPPPIKNSVPNNPMQLDITNSKIVTALARSLPQTQGINLNGIQNKMLKFVDNVINTNNSPVFNLQASTNAWAQHGSVLQS